MSVTELRLPGRRAAQVPTLYEKRMYYKHASALADPSATRIVLLASFSVHPLEPYLGHALDNMNLPANLLVGPFDQIAKEILDTQSETTRFSPHWCVVWPRLEDLWRGRPLPGGAGDVGYGDDLLELARLVASNAAEGGCKFIFVLPAIPPQRPMGLGDAFTPLGVHAAAVQAREAARSGLAGVDGVSILDLEETVRTRGEDRAYDWRLISLARIPYTDAFFDEVGQRLARIIGLTGKPGVIAFDPDTLLWDGRLADSGPQGVNLAQGETGEPHLQFQAFLADCRRAGHRLAVCSSQDGTALDHVFARREMLLARDDFAAFLGDQADPVSGLRRIIEDTGTNAADLVYLGGDTSDDLGAIAAAFPAVRTLALDQDPAGWPLAMERAGLLDCMPPITDALPRPDRAASGPPTLEDFRKRLELECSFEPIGPESAPRVAHLSETVTELNFTGEVLSVAQVQSRIASGKRDFFGIRVKDRFGDYGIAGMISLSQSGDQLSIEAFLLNCRVLGRGVEWVTLEWVASVAQERRVVDIVWEYRATERNRIALDLLRRLAPEICAGCADRTEARFDLARFQEQVSRRGEGADASTAPPSDGPTGTPALSLLQTRQRRLPASHRFRLGMALTQELRTPARALRAVQQEQQARRPALETAYVEPRTLLERQLANIWGKVLGVARVGAYDNFFHIGGQSVLATQLIFELERTFDVELPVRVFFENPTVALMARTIEALQSVRDMDTFNTDAVSAALVTAGAQLRAEVELEDSVRLDPGLPVGDGEKPAAVLLTGTTGFLGAFLLRELLDRTDALIYCHCRAPDQDQAMERIRRNVTAYFPWPLERAARIVPVPGDLSKPGLGVEPGIWHRLEQEIDIVVNNGAVTNFVDPYSKLKGPNVLAAREILGFCCRGKTKPLHHISTLYVFAPSDGEDRHILPEECVPDHPEELHVGYRQSKWVAERIIGLAKGRGLPITTYRLGRLSGCSETGACHSNDFLWRMIRAGVEAGCVMDNRISMDMAPVDHVARCLTHLMLKPSAWGKSYHIFNPRVPNLGIVADWIRSFGVPLREVSYADWRIALMDRARQDPESASAALIAFLPQTIDQWSDFFTFDQTNTQDALSGSPYSIPPVDEALFHRYVSWFTKTGFFAATHIPEEV